MAEKSALPQNDSWPAEESFEKQMNDLGVEVVKRKPEQLKNIKWLITAGKAGALGDRISINKNSISLGDEAAKMLSEDSAKRKLRFAVAEYQNKKVLVIKNSKTGYKLSMHGKSNGKKAGSPALVKMILENGLQCGSYKVRKATGGVICIPEERQA